jgi:SPASM domain peptide maturase of grasp-with-spasm system
LKNRTVEDVIERYNYDPEVIYAEIEKLEKNELGYWHDDPKKFPELDLSWYSPEIINNAIIEVGKNYKTILVDALAQLNDLGCKHIEFRLDDNIRNTDIRNILTMLEESKVRGVFIIQRFIDLTQIAIYIKHLENFPRLLQVVLHSFDQSKNENLSDYGINAKGKILLTNENLTNSHCGFISPNKFVSNIDNFTESINHNSCLNKKVSIDLQGNLLNCPAIKTIYGNVKTDSLIDVINQETFKSIWSVSKDKIEKCSSCEFRHVCTDCRAFIEEPNNLKSKPLKCGYDPATGIWENWSLNPLKQKAMAFYGLTISRV